MEYVYLVQATQDQIEKIMNLLDKTLKKDGMEALQDVVEIYNLLMQASRLQVQPAPEEAQQTLAAQDQALNPTTPDFPG